MKKSVRLGIIVLVAMLVIGFAIVTTTLVINGTAKVGQNAADFDVYFSRAVAEEGGTATISQNKKEITYTTKQLMAIGDIAELNYRVTNDSSQYDAYVKVSVDIDESVSNYVTVSYDTFNPENDTTVEAKRAKEGKITIVLNKATVDDMNVTFTVTLTVDAMERTSAGKAETYDASEVGYSHGATVTNVKEALDDLRRRLK